MDTIEKGLRERLNELLMIEASAKRFLKTAPEGKIYTKISHGKCQYARRIDEGNQRRIEYIRKKNALSVLVKVLNNSILPFLITLCS